MFAGLTSLMSSGAHAAAAHAIYEGFTVCDKTREFGHGLLVGFGNLCLLALENRSDEELLEAIGLARACAIPLSLREIAELDSTELAGIIDMALHAPDMANMPAPVTAGALYKRHCACGTSGRVVVVPSAAYPDGGKREYAVSLLSVFVRAGAHCESVKRITPFAHQNGLTLERRRVGEKIELHQRVAVPLIELEILIANTQRRIARARCHREVEERAPAPGCGVRVLHSNSAADRATSPAGWGWIILVGGGAPGKVRTSS